jgi:hypothetical protein
MGGHLRAARRVAGRGRYRCRACARPDLDTVRSACPDNPCHGPRPDSLEPTTVKPVARWQTRHDGLGWLVWVSQA